MTLKQRRKTVEMLTNDIKMGCDCDTAKSNGKYNNN